MDDRIDPGPETVRALIAEQFPQWAHLPVTAVRPGGWDNRTFRLGDRMSVRLPSAARYAGQVAREAAVLPRLAPRLPLPIPRPLALGRPGAGYPFPWAIMSWIAGAPANVTPPPDPRRFAMDLAAFLRALHALDPAGGPAPGPANFHRGGRLAAYDGEVADCLAALAGRVPAEAAAVWAAALAAVRDAPPVWVHGDVAPGNLLLHEGRLAAVIDFGGTAVGDPACDLVIAWTLLDGDAREAFRAGVGLDAATWARARGWALWKALLILAGRSAPARGEAAPERVIAAVIAEHVSR